MTYIWVRLNMQASVCYEALPAVLAALTNHVGERAVQTKGLVLLGVLMQGDDDALLVRVHRGPGVRE
jgi:hypothetical protein